MNTRSKCSNQDCGLSVSRYGRRGHRAVVVDHDATRAQGAQVEEHRRGAGAAVEREAYGPRAGVGILEQVGGGPDRGFGLAALLVQAAGRHRNECGHRAVRQGTAAERDAAFARARTLREQLLDLVAQALLVLVGGGGGRGGGRLGHRGSAPGRKRCARRGGGARDTGARDARFSTSRAAVGRRAGDA